MTHSIVMAEEAIQVFPSVPTLLIQELGETFVKRGGHLRECLV